mgnify:CR=1 FL=1
MLVTKCSYPPFAGSVVIKREVAANERQDEYEAYVCGGEVSTADAFYEAACEQSTSR